MTIAGTPPPWLAAREDVLKRWPEVSAKEMARARRLLRRAARRGEEPAASIVTAETVRFMIGFEAGIKAVFRDQQLGETTKRYQSWLARRSAT